MSEYWVSQAKHYCKVCNCYIADNKTSIAHHENGSKHKEKVEILQKQKRQDKLHGARSEVELKQQLAEIEKAAKEAIAVDRAEQGGYFYQVRHTSHNHPTLRIKQRPALTLHQPFPYQQNAGMRGRPPPPPAPRPPGMPKPSDTNERDDQDDLEDDDG